MVQAVMTQSQVSCIAAQIFTLRYQIIPYEAARERSYIKQSSARESNIDSNCNNTRPICEWIFLESIL